MQGRTHLEVELYAQGGWWKDSTGRTGQVVAEHARKGPLATVAALANGFGTVGWQLTDFVGAQHNSYRLSFELIAKGEHADEPPDPVARHVTIHLG